MLARVSAAARQHKAPATIADRTVGKSAITVLAHRPVEGRDIACIFDGFRNILRTPLPRRRQPHSVVHSRPVMDIELLTPRCRRRLGAYRQRRARDLQFSASIDPTDSAGLR